MAEFTLRRNHDRPTDMEAGRPGTNHDERFGSQVALTELDQDGRARPNRTDQARPDRNGQERPSGPPESLGRRAKNFVRENPVATAGWTMLGLGVLGGAGAGLASQFALEPVRQATTALNLKYQVQQNSIRKGDVPTEMTQTVTIFNGKTTYPPGLGGNTNTNTNSGSITVTPTPGSGATSGPATTDRAPTTTSQRLSVVTSIVKGSTAPGFTFADGNVVGKFTYPDSTVLSTVTLAGK